MFCGIEGDADIVVVLGDKEICNDGLVDSKCIVWKLGYLEDCDWE